jgi:integrase
VANELVLESVHRRLTTLDPLREGRTNAAESKPVEPVTNEQLEAVQPYLTPAIWALVQVQLLSAARPGEVVGLRAIDIDTSGDVCWTCRVEHHKTSHLNRCRVLVFGPRARAILAERMTGRPTTAPLFASDRTPDVAPTVEVLRENIARVCELAYPLPKRLERRRVPGRGRRHKSTRWETPAEWRARLGPAQWAEVGRWRAEHRWHPHQLRHLAATRIRSQYDLETASVVLGHADTDVTESYAARDLLRVEDVMRKMG